jgi:uncharacterized protein YegL
MERSQREKVEQREKIETLSKTVVGNSGNSDVDLTVHIEIDTKSIAYGMLCSLYAKGEISDFELEKGLRKLEDLIDRDKRNKKHHSNNDTRPKLFQFPGTDEKKSDRHRSDRKKTGSNNRNWI